MSDQPSTTDQARAVGGQPLVDALQELAGTGQLTDRPKTAVERTLAEMAAMHHDRGRVNRGVAFVKRAKKSDARRRIEKATRKRMRRR